MTLTITVATRWGVWQSADQRLTRDRVPIPGLFFKQVAVQCRDGAMAIAYAGFGRVLDSHRRQIELSDWVVRFLRGRSRTIDEAIDHIHQMSRRRLEPMARGSRMRIGHIFSFGVVRHGQQPQLVVITNAQMTPGPNFSLEPGLEISAYEPPKPHRALLVMGSGSWFVDEPDRALLDRVRDFPPRRPDDYRAILAGVNHRTASRSSKQVSESCTTCFIDPALRIPPQMHLHGDVQSATHLVPTLSHGLDGNELMSVVMRYGRPGLWDNSPEAVAHREREFHDETIRAITPDE